MSTIRDSNKVSDKELYDRVSILDYSYRYDVQISPQLLPPSNLWVPDATSLEAKRPERGADHSPPFTAVV
jgi:hypothetical protein